MIVFSKDKFIHSMFRRATSMKTLFFEMYKFIFRKDNHFSKSYFFSIHLIISYDFHNSQIRKEKKTIQKLRNSLKFYFKLKF
jgi:hypothetical protein